MNAPQIIRTPGGEELVLLSRADYDLLIARLSDAEEDAADVAAYDDALARLKNGEDRVLSAAESAAAIGPSAKLRALRKARGMSQAELSMASGVSQPFISKVERGEVGWSAETCAKVARALVVDPDQLA